MARLTRLLQLFCNLLSARLHVRALVLAFTCEIPLFLIAIE
jgi:hypothetical protein